MIYGYPDLERRFGADVLRHARWELERGEVRLIAPSYDGRVLYGVRGGRKRMIAINVHVSGRAGVSPTFHGDCRCGKLAPCPHTAALLLAGLRREESRGEASGRAPEGRAETGLRAAREAAIATWLGGVERALAGEPERPESPHVVLYLLIARFLGGGNAEGEAARVVRQVTVRVVTARARKSGGYSRASSIGYRGGAQLPAYVREEDLPIFGALQAAALAGWTTDLHAAVALQPALGPRVLEAALATGRCHWERADGPRLAPGPRRRGQIEWCFDTEGAQRPEVRVEGGPAIALPLRPCWYVDPSTGQCGPLDLDVTPEVAAAWLAAPALDPEAAKQVRARAARLPGVTLPLPALVTVEAEHVAAPRPCIEMIVRRKRVAHWARELASPTIRLAFDYGGTRVAGADEPDVVHRVEQGVVRRLRRDRAAEERAAEMLRELGLAELDPGYFEPLLAGEDLDEFEDDDDFDLAEDPTDGLDAGETEFFLHFARKHVPRLRAEGWQVEIAADFPYRFVEGEEWYADLRQETGREWFDLELGIEVDGRRESLLPILLRLLRDPELDLGDPQRIPDDREILLRLPGGRWFPLSGRRLKVIAGTLVELYGTETSGGSGALPLSVWNAPRLAELEDALGPGALRWSGGEALRQLARRLREFDGLREVPVPEGFGGTLRAYQRQGLDWMQFLREHELAGILADDMGLGKTVQVLAHLLVEKHAGRMDRPSLVVAPTSLMANWRLEAARFTPALSLLILQGPGRRTRLGAMAEHDVVVTTYPLLARDEALLKAHAFHLLILDEAQFIKNPRSKAAQIASALEARHRLCLTGTPMENHLGELWSLFHFLLPGLLGERALFSRIFRTPIEKHASRAHSAQLAARVRPFLLRRTKEQVAVELPPKTEMTQVVELHDAQRDLYEAIRLAMHERVRKEVARKGLARSQIVILDALLKLRQVCCDPRLLPGRAAAGVTASAKREALSDMLDELLAERRRILLFSQFTSMLELIEEDLRRKGAAWVKLTGSTRDRLTPVQRFQDGEVPLFLISLKAGGTGLNLQAADTVIHYDPWWNPAVEQQATDRAHRIGQNKPVFVYKLIAAGSVEEKILALQERKRALAQGIYAPRGADAPPLSAEDLELLFRPLT